MDEILLTHDEQGDAIDTALAHCTRDRELSPVHTVANEVCRAQVRKVYEWLQNETEPRDPSHYWLGARRMLDDKTLCALREAAGGEG